jgi:hypothetical protein
VSLFRNHWDLGAHGGGKSGLGKECLTKTRRPGFVSTVRPDLTNPTHGFREEDTLGGILFLRLKTSHLRLKDRGGGLTTILIDSRLHNLTFVVYYESIKTRTKDKMYI